MNEKEKNEKESTKKNYGIQFIFIEDVYHNPQFKEKWMNKL